MPRHVLALALAVLAVAAGCGQQGAPLADAPPATEGERSPFFGVNGDVVYLFLVQGREALVDRHLDQIAAAPISYVRAGIGWRRIEPEPPDNGEHRYDFSKPDAWVGRLASRGLHWTPNLLPIPIPVWAADPDAYRVCGSRAPPAGLADYAELVAAIAERYGTGGSFWKEHPGLPALPVTEYEIWNEPNHSSFWCPRPDPSAFAKITVAASRAIRALDRNAQIVHGGLAPYVRSEAPDKPGRMDFEAFLNAAVAAQPALPDAVDAVAIHPYGPDPRTSIERVRRFRRALDKAGFTGKPMVVNELGWPRQGPQGFAIPDEEARADALLTLIEALTDARRILKIESVAPYSWMTAEMDSQDQSQWFGLADPQTTEPYASGKAYRDVVERISSGR